MWIAICFFLFVHPTSSINSQCAVDSFRDSCELESAISTPSQSNHGINNSAMCHLMSPKIEADNQFNYSLPDILATNFENTIIMTLPFGFYRLRKSFLSDDSDFWMSSILSKTLHYKNISTTGNETRFLFEFTFVITVIQTAHNFHFLIKKTFNK